MSFLDLVVSKSVGNISNKYKTLGTWLDVYQTMVSVKEISNKTKANMLPAIMDLKLALGDKIISRITPMDIAEFILRYKSTPSTAKRRLNETKRVFYDAVCYGWINNSPASVIKPPKVRVMRKRLGLEDWKKIYKHSKDNQRPWVSRALILALVSGQRRGDVINIKFSDVKDGHLYIKQGKTDSKIALPLELKLDCLSTCLGDIVADCMEYSQWGETLIRKNNGDPICPSYVSAVFEEARDRATKLPTDRTAPSFHEIRSLSERLYRSQGVDTKTLLGHKHQYVTDTYNDPRNEDLVSFRKLVLP